MIVAVARAEFHLPTSRSLKEKRRFLKSLIERLHQRLRLSIAETAHHDLHQRAEIGIAFVHVDHSEANKRLDEIHQILDNRAEAYLIAWDADTIEDLS